jgi:hypothetical protein
VGLKLLEKALAWKNTTDNLPHESAFEVDRQEGDEDSEEEARKRRRMKEPNEEIDIDI